jgi:hypothetical protein
MLNAQEPMTANPIALEENISLEKAAVIHADVFMITGTALALAAPAKNIAALETPANA